MIMCYNFFVGMCSRCSELVHSKFDMIDMDKKYDRIEHTEV